MHNCRNKVGEVASCKDSGFTQPLLTNLAPAARLLSFVLLPLGLGRLWRRRQEVQVDDLGLLLGAPQRLHLPIAVVALQG